MQQFSHKIQLRAKSHTSLNADVCKWRVCIWHMSLWNIFLKEGALLKVNSEDKIKVVFIYNHCEKYFPGRAGLKLLTWHLSNENYCFELLLSILISNLIMSTSTRYNEMQSSSLKGHKKSVILSALKKGFTFLAQLCRFLFDVMWP